MAANCIALLSKNSHWPDAQVATWCIHSSTSCGHRVMSALVPFWQINNFHHRQMTIIFISFFTTRLFGCGRLLAWHTRLSSDSVPSPLHPSKRQRAARLHIGLYRDSRTAAWQTKDIQIQVLSRWKFREAEILTLISLEYQHIITINPQNIVVRLQLKLCDYLVWCNKMSLATN